uniref:Shisa family member 4 n=1 Tax=Molossus molossus TaxID=27622 RepID=A0A7J8BNM8_MOLMO|nr:shisa family member 4 [Molossus molossus]
MAFPPILLMLGVPLALAGTSCLGYVDEQDSWHPGFSCQPFTFCCGTCHHRFCCRDQSLLIPEFQQKRCLGLSPKVTAGIASAVMLFVALMATAVCCFCTCCYLSRRRQQLQVPFAGQEIPMTGHIVYPYPQDPKAGPAPLPPGFMCPPSGPPQHPLYPPGIPNYSPAARLPGSLRNRCLLTLRRCPLLFLHLAWGAGDLHPTGPPSHTLGQQGRGQELG